ncbi:MAG: hypothetical protein LW875_06170 [Proteobacteria bacterium]|jgi:hypothetical protein|nr:hypothetical protein [Pseudomonadota bacterium]
MKPRLKTSKKWTAFPEEYRTQIEDVFRQEFSEKLGQSKLIVDGRIYPEEIVLRVGFLEKGRIVQNNFEASATYKAEGNDAMDNMANCIDAVASMMSDFFQAGEEGIEFPLSWQEYEFEGRKIWLQFSTENSDLEKEADRILGMDQSSLVNEEEESDDLYEQEPGEINEPSMFSGKGKKKKKEEMH